MTPTELSGGSSTSVSVLAPSTWTPWTRQVGFRFAVLLVAYLTWFGFFLFSVHYHWGNSSTGGPGIPTTPPTTMYQGSPGLTRTLLAGVAIAYAVETASVLWRVARRSTRVGVTGMVVAILGGAIALMGFMTIGMFIALFAGICMVLALPIGPGNPYQGNVSAPAPPGWYWDPTGRPQWRFWDGGTWTGYVATSDHGVVGSRR